VANKSLPTISYLTSLDKYALLNILFLCLLVLVHSVITFIKNDEIAVDVNFYGLYSFIGLFVLLQALFVIKFLRTSRKISHLKQTLLKLQTNEEYRQNFSNKYRRSLGIK
jgi:amino acid permease